MSYPILTERLVTCGITKNEVAKTLGLHRNAVIYKLKKGSFSIEEALLLRDKYFPNCSLRELFKKE